MEEYVLHGDMSPEIILTVCRFPTRSPRGHTWLGRSFIHLRDHVCPFATRAAGRYKPRWLDMDEDQLRVHLWYISVRMSWIRWFANFSSGLDARNVPNYKKYFEVGVLDSHEILESLSDMPCYQLPALLLATLCYSFWLSFTRAGKEVVSPQAWPVAWFLLALCVLVNPLPILERPSRFWFVRNVARLATSGAHVVRVRKLFLYFMLRI